MSVHKVLQKTIMVNEKSIFIKYWCDKTTVYVAGFDSSGKQVTAATYSAVVADIAKG